MADVVGILFKRSTVIKQTTGDSSQVPSNQRLNVPVGTFLILQSYSDPSNNTNHYKFTLKNLQFKGYNTWYAYAPDVQVTQQPLHPVQTIGEVVSKQTEKNVAKILVDKKNVPAQGSFLKLVFNVDTTIKRKPVDAQFLNDDSKQTIPAGTQLILATDKPDANNFVKFPIEDSHVKVTFTDVEFKGFNKDWYVFMNHAGIQRLG